MGNRVETQDRLLAATRQIIINEGIEATSLEHICSVAGFTRGAFYSNFSSKDSLLGILAEAEYSDLIQRLRERGSPTRSLPRSWASCSLEAQPSS